jgi:RNA-directed DNA polymerase
MSPSPSQSTKKATLTIGFAVFTAFLLCGAGVMGVVTLVANADPTVLFWALGAFFLVVGVLHVRKAIRRGRFAAGGDPTTAERVANGDGFDVDALAKRLGTTSDALRAAQCVYREARIPKRRGGERRLLIPDDATKAMQRRILRRVLGGLRAHPSATGFERGKSIVDNALPHVGKLVVVKMDVVDFFPSTKSARVLRYFQWIGWNREAAEILTRLTSWEDGLPQGAPTSPRLSNLVNFYFDVQLASIAAKYGGVFTRYADDVTLSFDHEFGTRVRGAIQAVMAVGRPYGYRFHVRRKFHVARRHQRQIVTGLVVNDGVRLPREIRRRLRATRHRMSKGQPPLQGAASAQGWFAYERMIESQARTDVDDRTSNGTK